MAKFQVKLAGEWKDYGKEEDKILKRAFMAGFPCAKFHLRGSNYTYEFKKMTQLNTDSRKERQIRAPRGWKQPSKPLVPAGPTTCINVPPGSPGTTIQVPHPKVKGAFIAVSVPRTAKVGQAMLVPVPPASEVAPAPIAAAPAKVAAGGEGTSGHGWSTGAKVAAGGAAVVGVGAAVVGGVALGEHIAEHGFDATVEAAGDGIADAAEAVGEFAVDAGEFVVDELEDVGEFIMDLF